MDDCSQFDEMPYLNKSTNSYDCYPTLEVGPCKPKEWFVLIKENPNYAKCVENKCGCGPVSDYTYEYGNEEDESESQCINKIQEEGFIYVEFEGKCLEIKDTDPCPFGQWLVPDEYGEGKS